MDRGAQWAIVNGATKSQTWLTEHTHTREKEEWPELFVSPSLCKNASRRWLSTSQEEGPHQETSHASTLILGFLASIWWEIKYPLFKSDSLWHFVISSLIRLRQKNKSVENVLHYQMCKTEIQNLNTKWSRSETNDKPYFNISSLHCLCVAKQAIAHILISTPVWNCFPRMSHTPWLGVATVRFYREREIIRQKRANI